MAVERVTLSSEGTSPTPTPTPTPTERPANIPEKFWKDGKVDVEGMAKSYGELETRLGTTPTPTPTPVPAATAAAVAKLDMAALAQEFTKNNGKLTEATLADLATKGITAEQVQTHIAGVQAQANAIAAEITKVAGGDEGLTQVYSWAKANMKPEEIAAYDSIMDRNDMQSAKLAFAGLMARYTEATGKEAKLVAAETTPTHQGPIPFASNYEITKAMSDPRYKRDAAYRKTVEDRMKVTSITG